MKPLEEFLNHTRKPKVQVPVFRQVLRRRLLNSHRYIKKGVYKYRSGFYVSAGLASIFAVILALFVANPGIPQKVHRTLRSDSRFIAASKSPSGTPEIPGAVADSQIRELPQDAMASLEGFFPKEVDEAFVRMLTENKMKQKHLNIQQVSPSEFYAVNRFRLDNGKDVVVYTQVPLTQVSTRESY